MSSVILYVKKGAWGRDHLQISAKDFLYIPVCSNDKLWMRWWELIKIRDFATLCGCSVHTLRYYDEVGLLKPAIVCQSSDYRYYSEEQVQCYLEIKEFQEIGFSIQEIKDLAGLAHLEIAVRILDKIDEMQEQMDLTSKVLRKYLREKPKEAGQWKRDDRGHGSNDRGQMDHTESLRKIDEI